MGILDRLFGQERPASPKDVQRTPEASPNDQALERYRYLVRTAPPEAIEQAHREAFEISYETTHYRLSRLLYILAKPLFLLPGSRKIGWNRL